MTPGSQRAGVTLAQCVMYDRGAQKFSSPIGYACAGTAATAALCTLCVSVGWDPSWLSWLNLLIGLSFMKMGISLVKYIPQVPVSPCLAVPVLAWVHTASIHSALCLEVVAAIMAVTHAAVCRYS